MKRLIVLALLLLTACSYEEVHLQLRVDNLTDGNIMQPDARLHRAEVWVPESTASLRADAVKWKFGGSLAPGRAPGTFRIVGPGEGLISASFMAGTLQTLCAKIRVIGPSLMPARRPPLPVATTSSTSPPVAAPSAPSPSEPERLILQAYRLSDKGAYFDALKLLLPIQDPAWMPKVRSLDQQWADPAFSQGLEHASRDAAAGRTAMALQTLDFLQTLPVDAARLQLVREFRHKVEHRP